MTQDTPMIRAAERVMAVLRAICMLIASIALVVLIATFGWLVFGLSVSAILLLMWLIRRGAASQVASLFYLVPPVTALEAFILFDERLGPMAMAGGVVAVAGVALVVAPGPRKARSA